jgi:hypothetical protein
LDNPHNELSINNVLIYNNELLTGMSRLLLLADVAVGNDDDEYQRQLTKKTAEIAVQTDPPVSSTDVTIDDRSVHDYARISIVDFLVNSTHDYYDRVLPAATDNEFEHSYAFAVPSIRSSSSSYDYQSSEIEVGCITLIEYSLF